MALYTGTGVLLLRLRPPETKCLQAAWAEPTFRFGRLGLDKHPLILDGGKKINSKIVSLLLLGVCQQVLRTFNSLCLN